MKNQVGELGRRLGGPGNPASRRSNFVRNPHCRTWGKIKVPPRDKSVIRLPSLKQVKSDASAVRPPATRLETRSARAVQAR
jgi:hypothetical protein